MSYRWKPRVWAVCYFCGVRFLAADRKSLARRCRVHNTQSPTPQVPPEAHDCDHPAKYRVELDGKYVSGLKSYGANCGMCGERLVSLKVLNS